MYALHLFFLAAFFGLLGLKVVRDFVLWCFDWYGEASRPFVELALVMAAIGMLATQ